MERRERRLRLAVGVLLCGLWSVPPVSAQAGDPNLLREVAEVRTVVARNDEALHQYTWTEHTEVLVKGEVKSSNAVTCRYDRSGKLTRTPIGEAPKGKRANANSNKPQVRKKAAMQDYIERATTLIRVYVPLKPDRMQAMLQNGSASLGKSGAGKSEIRFTGYFQGGDSLVFTYDPVSKALLQANIASALGGPKDPVTMEAVFETSPDGVNHLASTNLNATAKKIQIRTKNDTYQKLAD